MRTLVVMLYKLKEVTKKYFHPPPEEEDHGEDIPDNTSKLSLECLWKMQSDIAIPLCPSSQLPTRLGRFAYDKLFGLHLTTLEELNVILQFVEDDKVLSIGTVKAWMEMLLQRLGVDVLVADGWRGKTWTHVEDVTAVAAVRRYRDRKVLFMCWPVIGVRMCQEAIRQFQGHKIIVIGDLDDRIFRTLKEELYHPQIVCKNMLFDLDYDNIYLFTKGLINIKEEKSFTVEQFEGVEERGGVCYYCRREYLRNLRKNEE